MGNAYIIIDALDECTKREELFNTFNEILSWQLDLRFLATSQKLQSISDSLEPLATMQINLEPKLIGDDIRMFISETLKGDVKLKKWGKEIHAEIKAALMKGANEW